MIFVYTGVVSGLCGGVTPVPLSSFLSLMKEKKAKENQGDDRCLFFSGYFNGWVEIFLSGRSNSSQALLFHCSGGINCEPIQHSIGNSALPTAAGLAAMLATVNDVTREDYKKHGKTAEEDVEVGEGEEK